MTTHINPLVRLVRKQRVGQDDADQIALPVLIHFDAAKRGQCSNAGANFLATHLIIASYIASATKSKSYHDRVMVAYKALEKAMKRPTVTLDLTTPEYKSIREALAIYLRSLAQVEIGVMNDACLIAQRNMQ